MKILHLDGSGEDIGGVLSLLRNLASASAPLGWRHVVWVNERYAERRRPALEYRHSRHIVSDSPSHLKIAVQALRASVELRRRLRAEPFDIVHAHSRGTLLAGMLATASLRRPLIFTNHNYARRRGLYRWAARQRNLHTVLLTPTMADYYGIPPHPQKVSIISACYADGFLELPLVERRSWQNEGRPLRLLGVGTLIRWKKWHLLAEAMARLHPQDRERIQFSLFGPTSNSPESVDYEQELRELVAGLGLEKQFHFRGPTVSVANELRQTDWLVLPSTNEPCSVALMEALALGLPVLVARSGGSLDFVQSERTGLFFEPDDAGDLAAHLHSILAGRFQPPSPKEIRDTVRDRSASGVLPQYEQLYRHVMAHSRHDFLRS